MKISRKTIVLPFLAVLVGCASVPTAPSVMALPGSGKNFSEFRMDDAQCRQYASRQIGDTTNDVGVRNAVVGTAIGAAAGAAIGGHQGAGIGAGAGLLIGSTAGAESSRSATYGSQRHYDNAYVQCMYARGHKVPVSANFSRSMMQAPAQSTSSGNYPPPPPPYSPPSSPPPDYFPPPPAPR